MVPIPSHLLGWVLRTSKSGEGPYVRFAVRCPCGNEELELHYPGTAHPSYDSHESIPCTIELQQPEGPSRFYFGIKAVCPSCRAERLLFDCDLHGWELVTNGAEYAAEKARLERPRLFAWHCLVCGAESHRGWVGISLDSKVEFLDRVRGQVDEAKWPDAFTWIDMGIKCCRCGHENNGWVSYECG
jgi:hypothetical protein